MPGGLYLEILLDNGPKVKISGCYKQKDIIQLAAIIEKEAQAGYHVSNFRKYSYPHQNPKKNSMKFLLKGIFKFALVIVLARLFKS